jgi:hypothetical protein
MQEKMPEHQVTMGRWCYVSKEILATICINSFYIYYLALASNTPFSATVSIWYNKWVPLMRWYLLRPLGVVLIHEQKTTQCGGPKTR